MAAWRVEQLWGTAISVDVRDVIVPTMIDSLFDWFRHVDDLFSTWRDDTEISRIGRAELHVDNASPEVREVLALCDRVRRESEGMFDITVGAHAHTPALGLGPLDPSGLVKGWALDRAAEMLERAGVARFSINAGGDVVVRGRLNSHGGAWRVGIQHPWERDKVAAIVAVVDAGVATSGRYERGDHVLDPRTGRPAHGLASVTVIGPDLGLADGYATAAIARGRDGMAWLATRDGYDAMGITDNHEVLLTPGFSRHRAQ